jgi:16S rRNA (uracil1498-N3)-methyltransferase
MPHLHRFYIDPEAIGDAAAELSGAEAHHALHVVRIREGDEVALFDGRGGRWRGRVVKRGRGEVQFELLEAERVEPPPVRLTLVQAMLRRDKALEALARRVTELGVARVVLFEAERSERPAKVHDKVRNAAVEAAKQCGQAWLPAWRTAGCLEEALGEGEGGLLVATADRPPVPLTEALGETASPAVVVGPAGDLTGEELERALARGGQPISLGEITFRAEQAAALACALVMYERGRLGPRAGGPRA